MSVQNGHAQLCPRRHWKKRPDERDCPGHERCCGTRPAQGERLAPGAEAGYLLAWREQAAASDRCAEICLIKGPAVQIASGDRDDPGVGGDDGASDCALIAGRGHEETPRRAA
jgi:hypothetical protein